MRAAAGGGGASESGGKMWEVRQGLQEQESEDTQC